MAIDVDAIVTDEQLDVFMGGQLLGAITLIPVSWNDSAKPAREWAVDTALRYFRDATPSIEESRVDPSTLDEIVRCGAVARLYELALMRSPGESGFATMLKTYTARFEREVRKQIDIIHKTMTPDRKGRGRRTVSIERR